MASDSDHLAALDKLHLWHPFTPMRQWCADEHEPLVLVEGRGCVLKDQHGREYLDGNSSIWTNIHGHNHPTIDASIRDQLGRVAHTSFLGFTNPPAIRLASELIELFPGGKLTRVFYSDDGSTAIEVAAKMALQFWQQNGSPQRDTVLVFARGYHGDTLGAASLGGIPVFKGAASHFGYRTICAPDLSALQKLDRDQTGRLAAVVIEPLVQGAAGMKLWPPGMLGELSAWCREQDVLLVLDEVLTGFGRTGKMFACEHEGVVPDMIALAKGLTGGYLPLAATLTTERVFEGFLGDVGAGRTFFYGHSYCGNQLGCAAALGSLQVFRNERVLESLPAKIARLAALLDELKELPQVLEVRQCGLIAGIEIAKSRNPHVPYPPADLMGARVCLAARKHGLLTRPILNTVVLMPPLCVRDDELEQMVRATRLAINEVCR